MLWPSTAFSIAFGIPELVHLQLTMVMLLLHPGHEGLAKLQLHVLMVPSPSMSVGINETHRPIPVEHKISCMYEPKNDWALLLG